MSDETRRKVGTNGFARRQTPESRFSHYEGPWDALEALVEANIGRAATGAKDGILLVPVPPDGFFSGVVEVGPGTPLSARFEARRQGEQAYLEVLAAGGDKLPAKAVDVVAYRPDVLGDDATPGRPWEWEIVSINARPTLGPEPQHPVSMARNQLGLPGGTKAEYSADDFARAVVYWSTRAMRG
jgi:hypothetical protein